jgi:hypothetical protein
MADAGIKNVIVKKSLLGKVTSENSRVIRFRIVAEDKNRKSAWSQIFLVGSEAVTVLPGDLNIIGNTIFVNWSDDSSLTTQITYDIFASFDGGDFSHVGVTGNTSYSLLKTGTSSVRVIVQVASIKPAINSGIEIYDSGIRSLV